MGNETSGRNRSVPWPVAALFRLLRRQAERRLARVHSTEDFRAEARRRLPRMVFDYIEGGAGREDSLARNEAALRALGLVPAAPADVSRIDLGIRLFGRDLAMPIVIGPTGLASASWPEGELELARAAAQGGIPFVLANAASIAPEAVVEAAAGQAWFQLYPPPDMAAAEAWISRIKACGFPVLEVTVDVAVPGQRLRDARNAFAMPFRWTPAKFLDAALHPGWALPMAWHGAPTPFLALGSPPHPGQHGTQSELRRHRFSPALGWDYLARLRALWTGPMVIKGILDPAQAERATREGFDGIVISNHGGRQLDGAVSAIDMLPEIRASVGKDMTLLVDGGFRTGADIAKALALGADAVQLGRLPVHALATAGAAGVSRALSLLRADLETSLALCGVTHPGGFGPGMLRRFGAREDR